MTTIQGATQVRKSVLEIEGKAKAYALSAVHAPDKHVYNGLQGDRPVTVTFCDLADCVQVFTLDQSL